MMSTKVFDGYSTCFRQWRADGTHCRFLHGYGVSFKVFFQGEMDERNWVFDFGGMKRATHKIHGMSPQDYFSWLLDHTVIVAQDDPYLSKFEELHRLGVIQMRILPHVGCERVAQHLLVRINDFLLLETRGRVIATALEFREHDKNAAVATRGVDDGLEVK